MYVPEDALINKRRRTVNHRVGDVLDGNTYIGQDYIPTNMYCMYQGVPSAVGWNPSNNGGGSEDDQPNMVM